MICFCVLMKTMQQYHSDITLRSKLGTASHGSEMQTVFASTLTNLRSFSLQSDEMKNLQPLSLGSSAVANGMIRLLLSFNSNNAIFLIDQLSPLTWRYCFLLMCQVRQSNAAIVPNGTVKIVWLKPMA